jgi:hypothetical protein
VACYFEEIDRRVHEIDHEFIAIEVRNFDLVTLGATSLRHTFPFRCTHLRARRGFWTRQTGY